MQRAGGYKQAPSLKGDWAVIEQIDALGEIVSRHA
jgi:hypothetical protein